MVDERVCFVAEVIVDVRLGECDGMFSVVEWWMDLSAVDHSARVHDVLARHFTISKAVLDTSHLIRATNEGRILKSYYFLSNPVFVTERTEPFTCHSIPRLPSLSFLDFTSTSTKLRDTGMLRITNETEVIQESPHISSSCQSALQSSSFSTRSLSRPLCSRTVFTASINSRCSLLSRSATSIRKLRRYLCSC